MSKFNKNLQTIDKCLETVSKFVKEPKFYEKSINKTYLADDEYITQLFSSSTQIENVAQLDTMVNGKYYTVNENVYTFYKKEEVLTQTWSWMTFSYYDIPTIQVTEIHSFTKTQ